MRKRLKSTVEHYMDEGKPKKALKMKLKYQKDVCTRCNKKTTENTEHVFNCSSNDKVWTELKEKMLQKATEISKKKIFKFPFWFHKDTNDKFHLWKWHNHY